MVSIAFTLQALPEKRQELLQTMEALIEKASVMENCLRCVLQQDSEKLNTITLLMEWRSQEAFQAYQKSEHFGVLSGAVNLLCASKNMEYEASKK
jgi:quinol monooxygenase YgiN